MERDFMRERNWKKWNGLWSEVEKGTIFRTKTECGTMSWRVRPTGIDELN